MHMPNTAAFRLALKIGLRICSAFGGFSLTVLVGIKRLGAVNVRLLGFDRDVVAVTA